MVHLFKFYILKFLPDTLSAMTAIILLCSVYVVYELRSLADASLLKSKSFRFITSRLHGMYVPD